MCTVQGLGRASSDAALQMSNDSQATASVVMRQFLSIDSLISELLQIIML